MNKVLCEPITVSCEAKRTPKEFAIVSIKTKLASHQRIYALCEAKKASCEPKIASVKAIWIKKSNSVSCEVRDKSLDSASCEATIVSDLTISAFHKAKPRLSREAKAKAPLGANSETTAASSALLHSAIEALSRSAIAKAPSGANIEATTVSEVLSREARTKAPIGANRKVIAASFKSKVLLNSAKLASSCRGKALRAQAASPYVANSQGEAILASPTTKKRASKAKLKALQPKRANSQLP